MRRNLLWNIFINKKKYLLLNAIRKKKKKLNENCNKKKPKDFRYKLNGWQHSKMCLVSYNKKQNFYL